MGKAISKVGSSTRVLGGKTGSKAGGKSGNSFLPFGLGLLFAESTLDDTGFAPSEVLFSGEQGLNNLSVYIVMAFIIIIMLKR